mmetsp:Transcript_58699/g.143893  ORF Transcript_58699/g.143893 Transcript_58699/m.143893 type:complete len:203 (+) Transcript_58699:390-998(+)
MERDAVGLVIAIHIEILWPMVGDSLVIDQRLRDGALQEVVVQVEVGKALGPRELLGDGAVQLVLVQEQHLELPHRPQCHRNRAREPVGRQHDPLEALRPGKGGRDDALKGIVGQKEHSQSADPANLGRDAAMQVVVRQVKVLQCWQALKGRGHGAVDPVALEQQSPHAAPLEVAQHAKPLAAVCHRGLNVAPRVPPAHAKPH